MNKMMLAAVAVVVAGGATGEAARAENIKVCFEAESAGAVQTPLRKVLGSSLKPYSGKGFIEIPWDQNKTKGIGSATIRFKAPKAGVYTLWARVYWANGCGNSIAANVNGAGSDKVLGEDGNYDKWHWVGGRAKVSLKKGLNVLVLKNHETGVRVDEFFLCTDAEYTPVNVRPSTQ